MVKEGIHCTDNGSYVNLGKYIQELRGADKPLSIQSVDSTVGVFDAQHSGEHRHDGLVFRRTRVEDVDVDRLPVDGDTGLYTGSPEYMAEYHFNIINRNLPRIQPNGEIELDFENRVWTCSINEPSKETGDIEYLARYTLHIGNLFLNAKVKYLAYGWSTGTPEPEFWEHPKTIEYLQLCEVHPTMLGVSIHEYSLDATDIKAGYPYLLGRVENLLNTCVRYDITYPYIHIGEFGWTERHIDLFDIEAQNQLQWADEMYKALGISPNRCLWTLGKWHNTVDEIVRDVEGLLPSIINRCVTAPDEPEIEPPILPKIVILKVPQEANEGVWLRSSAYAYANYKRTCTASTDDMLTMLNGGNADSYAIVVNETEISQVEAIELLVSNDFNYEVIEL